MLRSMTEATVGDATDVLGEQAAYYRARAGEYDEWWQRVGRYDRGAEPTARWHAEVAEVASAIEARDLTGDVLELACGTGWWTERLARRAASLACLDASPEVVALNRGRIAAAGLPQPTYGLVDLFAWTPERAYDAVFFSFWLSHVPSDKFDPFWAALRGAVKPGGRVVFIDSAPDLTSGAVGHQMPDQDGLQVRQLNDGREFRVVKLYHEPAVLTSRLARLGWVANVRRTAHYFIFGSAELG